MTNWESVFQQYLQRNATQDKAHDLAHIQRVVGNAKTLANEEKANFDVVIPAAWLHDCVIVPKNSPERAKASSIAAKQAIEFLEEINYPREHLPAIEHAIAAHSFSANIETKTLEAKVVQDADRIDALGAVGLARCLITGAQLNLDLYSLDDPFCESRQGNDRLYTIDHFYCKLLKLKEQMKTTAGRKMAEERSLFLQSFLDQLKMEIT
ncbi:HD domain-containing protein [Candidatus Uabimicrobium amorphum]|uniref:Phosphohydrolase n=1 Tax=Uabimicrobium amorphum TaxID=2596890 RepID=A0A5S9IRB6_UABAM|nr:HD domain-containing protein [Candidatus Uabimicrobium amorphum]BBM85255.1 phosphohydrolase [Candidatus Uabimicrobium amorphum]